ncbi:hypothetical protein LSTR_LSTR014560 [Laodelphax striatellus]|uniref:Pre-nudix hydrolase domain-containing protein n=1 Tax=Laodelphax striatellus TaxID=195883 RepID=A0A482XBE4_LAOST|nr:hypothetical protein LSTR_LSTR014560 [Laodelphax striatellus]
MLKHYVKIYLYNIRKSIPDITCPNNLLVNNKRTFQTSRSMSSQTSFNSMEEGSTFAGKKDRYGGVIVNSTDEPCPSENATFAEKLKHSISKWTAEGVRGVWFIVTLQHAGWLPHLANVEDFLSDPDASAHNKKFVKNYLKCKELGIKMKMDDSVHDVLKHRQLWFTIDNENLPKNDGS